MVKVKIKVKVTMFSNEMKVEIVLKIIRTVFTPLGYLMDVELDCKLLCFLLQEDINWVNKDHTSITTVSYNISATERLKR